MAEMDGKPQHFGDTYAFKADSTNGVSAGYGDWSRAGHLFSQRDAGVPTQPPINS